MANSAPHKPLAVALAGYIILIVLMWTHRALTFPVLLPSAAGEGVAGVLAPFFVGALSDIWVAYLLTFITWFLATIGGKKASYIWLATLALLTAGHQAYVEFFHFQIVPAHIAYLLDTDFLAANAATAFSWRGLIILVAFVGMAAALNTIWFTTTLSRGRRAGWTLLALLPLCLLAHHKNIMLRENWFIPEPLRLQALENLFIRWRRFTPPTRLSADEVRELATNVGASDLRPFALLSRPPESDDRIAIALKQAFSASRAAQKRPVIGVILMESMRPSETGYFDPHKTSLTPRLDELAAKGIVFTQAFSTGSVTRGGQEAVLCGYLGSRDASLMRGNSLASIRCIPDELAAGDRRAGFFWYHGGEGRFDGQERFWSARKTLDSLSLKDFDKNAAHTGWGVGDLTFFRQAYSKLVTLRQDPRFDSLVGMMLSVSNHIPWNLPNDAPAALAAEAATANHPSYATTRYADDALGTAIDAAKKDGLWRDLILLAISDHGNDVAPYTELYANNDTRTARLESHINFMLAGGLVESALQTAGKVAPLVVSDIKSQADAAALIGFILGLDTPFMGEVPLNITRHLPVISELEQAVFVPAAGIATTRSAMASALTRPEEPPVMRTARLYYRLFLDFITRR